MNPYVAGGHEGFDFGATSGARFFSIGQGVVTEIELNTGQGFPGTNYRITIQYTPTIDAAYHFEIGGDVSEQIQRDNMLVAVNDTVTAGQHIGNLMSQSDAGHVDLAIYQQPGGGCPVPTRVFLA